MKFTTELKLIDNKSQIIYLIDDKIVAQKTWETLSSDTTLFLKDVKRVEQKPTEKQDFNSYLPKEDKEKHCTDDDLVKLLIDNILAMEYNEAIDFLQNNIDAVAYTSYMTGKLECLSQTRDEIGLWLLDEQDELKEYTKQIESEE